MIQYEFLDEWRHHSPEPKSSNNMRFLFLYVVLWYLSLFFLSFNQICILNAQIVSNENINYGPYADNAYYTINKNK